MTAIQQSGGSMGCGNSQPLGPWGVHTFLGILLVVAGCAHRSSPLMLFGIEGRSSQWDPDRRLTSDPAVSQLGYHFTKSLATDKAGRVHVVWYDTRDGTSQIYYKRSTDNGATWGPDIRLSDDPGPKEQPAVASSGSSVYVVWHDLRDGSMDVYFKRSLDGGNTWGPDIKLSHGPADSMYPSIVASGSHLHVTFADSRDGQIKVYYVRSLDGGVTWTPEFRLSDLPFDSWTPSVMASGDSVYVVWTDTRDGSEEEYFKRSTDGGRTWGPDTRLTNDLANSWAPVIEASGTSVHVVWFGQKESRIQPRDAEHKLDEIMALLLLPIQAEPSGVVLSMKPKNAKQRIDVKIRKIHAAAPAWIAQGGDVTQLHAILREAEQMDKPLAPFEAEKRLDEAMQLVGLPPQPAAPPGAEGNSNLDAVQARVQDKMRRIQAAVPRWVRRSGDIKQLRAKLNAFSRLARTQRLSYEEKEKTIDEAMRLLGLSFVPEEEVARVYYLDALEARIHDKIQQVQGVAPDWIRRGGDPARLDAILQEVEEMVKASSMEWALYYRRSTDGGATWEPETRLTDLPSFARRPSLSVVGRELHLVWYDMRQGSEGVYYKHSPDGGVTWGPETQVVAVNSDWVHPSVEASRDFVHVVWVDERDGNPEIYYKRKVSKKWSWNYGE